MPQHKSEHLSIAAREKSAATYLTALLICRLTLPLTIFAIGYAGVDAEIVKLLSNL